MNCDLPVGPHLHWGQQGFKLAGSYETFKRQTSKSKKQGYDFKQIGAH